MNVDMIDSPQKIYFYIPSQNLINNVPATIQEYWGWINEFVKYSPAPLATGEGLCAWVGPYNWTIQTFIYLRNSGFLCELTASLPFEGIIITHGDFLPKYLRASSKQFIVEIKPDRSLQCAYANYVIVQNRHDPVRKGIISFFIKSAYVNYWPQPGLIPRDPGRGDRFENICFMGNPEQFIRDIDLLESEVNKLGLKWSIVPRERWHDYQEVDAIVAVRPINVVKKTHNPITRLVNAWNDKTSPILSPERKPASKLCNAWIAGTPAILSPDIAFQEIRESELDYLEATNVMEIVERIKQLQNNPTLRKAMIENGNKRAVECNQEKIVQEWVKIIEKDIIPSYILWTKSSVYRNLFFFFRWIVYKLRCY